MPYEAGRGHKRINKLLLVVGCLLKDDPIARLGWIARDTRKHVRLKVHSGKPGYSQEIN